MSDFNRGPWTIGSSGQIIGSNGNTVALMLDDSPLTDANAHLIAAAPDMYRALRDIVNAVDRCESSDDLSLIDEFTEDMEQNARAALAKAAEEGK